MKYECWMYWTEAKGVVAENMTQSVLVRRLYVISQGITSVKLSGRRRIMDDEKGRNGRSTNISYECGWISERRRRLMMGNLKMRFCGLGLYVSFSESLEGFEFRLWCGLFKLLRNF